MSVATAIFSTVCARPLMETTAHKVPTRQPKGQLGAPSGSASLRSPCDAALFHHRFCQTHSFGLLVYMLQREYASSAITSAGAGKITGERDALGALVSQGLGAPSLAVLGPKGVVLLVAAGPLRSQGFGGAGLPAKPRLIRLCPLGQTFGSTPSKIKLDCRTAGRHQV